MYAVLSPYIVGVLMAWVTWFPARYLDARTEQWFFTIIITIVAVGFVGFPIGDGDVAGIFYEVGVMILLLALIFLSRKTALILLPVVWILHGAWDFLFLIGIVQVGKPLWLVQLCVPYDWLLGAYLFHRVSVWGASSADTVPTPLAGTEK